MTDPMRTYKVHYTDGSERIVHYQSVHQFRNFLHNEGDHVKNWEYIYERLPDNKTR